MHSLYHLWLAACGWRQVTVYETAHKASVEFRHNLFPVAVRVL